MVTGFERRVWTASRSSIDHGRMNSLEVLAVILGSITTILSGFGTRADDVESHNCGVVEEDCSRSAAGSRAQIGLAVSS
jgi:hypothetical protein